MGTCCVPAPASAPQLHRISDAWAAMSAWLKACQLCVLLSVVPALLSSPAPADTEELETFHDDPETVAEIVSQMEDLGLGGVKRAAPYNFGVGKRAPYNFGVGKRVWESVDEEKRSPYNFGVGKRSPYNFGVGKRDYSSYREDGWRKRMPYNFGVGRR